MLKWMIRIFFVFCIFVTYNVLNVSNEYEKNASIFKNESMKYLEQFNLENEDNYILMVKANNKITMDVKEMTIYINDDQYKINEITNKSINLNNGKELNKDIIPEIYFKNRLEFNNMYYCESNSTTTLELITNRNYIDEYCNLVEEELSNVFGEEIDLNLDDLVEFKACGQFDNFRPKEIMYFGWSELHSGQNFNDVYREHNLYEDVDFQICPTFNIDSNHPEEERPKQKYLF